MSQSKQNPVELASLIGKKVTVKVANVSNPVIVDSVSAKQVKFKDATGLLRRLSHQAFRDGLEEPKEAPKEEAKPTENVEVPKVALRKEHVKIVNVSMNGNPAEMLEKIEGVEVSLEDAWRALVEEQTKAKAVKAKAEIAAYMGTFADVLLEPIRDQRRILSAMAVSERKLVVVSKYQAGLIAQHKS